ncbi:adenosylmethionine--8-amino-7-oxononanoate transaminase [bacterium endosymbiont of Pedicinus badii]|uniref:adenosylmethionine--8-amino-7-oxononanoate transaminase n=1 Tax=bacterium endosymbiont of Pedicinus badii TaxID=1719126 RepID=UPI0009BB07F7|nr:adenosylmethionine--8-amino-7-oxononanoate transaminase [bacterium endosymbiont of Pedicinus badii]OQM34332.1 adenosylmethionine-8-amino-7-oxononanoate aminotransferase [bacterium endosymbiont of Pedicinus badii]
MNFQDIDFDKKHIWHPYTSIKNPLPVYPIVYAKDCYLFLNNGKKLIDGMSSWWSTIHGYNHPIINKAIQNQIKKMSHVMFGGITHQPAIDLCRKLIKIVPKNLECVFLSDSGSVSIEVAIKMALQYWKGKNNTKKNKFFSLKNGYHGDTFGAISVCDPKNSIHDLYFTKRNLFSNHFLESPKRKFGDTWKNTDIFEIEKKIKKYHKEVAALILEPIVQAIGGMNFYHKKYLIKIRELCYKYGILMICDEIATGFGRTGKLFACNYAKISPDILCIGKALTGGTITLAATLTTKKIAYTISNGSTNCFMHGPTFMANPLACASATASLQILENTNWKSLVSKISIELKSGLSKLEKHPMVKNTRVLGSIGVVETKFLINIKNIQKIFVKEGVWIRPFRNIIYLTPPYIISKKNIKKLIIAISKSLDHKKNFFLKN